jgi:hypothetical protein
MHGNLGGGTYKFAIAWFPDLPWRYNRCEGERLDDPGKEIKRREMPK